MTPRHAFAALALAAAVAAHAAPAVPPGDIKGEVLEAQDVDGYTYLRLKTSAGEMWAAVPTAAVKKGAQVRLVDPAVMQKFESKALRRTFDTIVFAQLAGPGALLGAPQPSTRPAAAPAPMTKVAKASGAGARTVAEVVIGKATLKNKAVVVRGQVVKVNTGIMGKNWLHLRDGSGAAADGSNDILVTTKDAASVGDIVTVKGMVRTDVTVGPGYAYDVLIDDAALSK